MLCGQTLTKDQIKKHEAIDTYDESDEEKSFVCHSFEAKNVLQSLKVHWKRIKLIVKQAHNQWRPRKIIY